ncbi:unnamed protein product [Orchesella dallaii]|uniref:Uncharacterized protein n=1 Tax=Orchesella dallaii TaxID=48710 RepID=A0ABP1RG19_9HEXA
MSKYVVPVIVIFSALIALSYCGVQDVLFQEYGSLDSKGDFYSEEYLNGQQYSVVLSRDECRNFAKTWQKKAVSVDTKGTCIRGCDQKDCQGSCVYLFPSHGEQKLSELKFAKKIISVSGCFRNRGKANADEDE